MPRKSGGAGLQSLAWNGPWIALRILEQFYLKRQRIVLIED